MPVQVEHLGEGEVGLKFSLEPEKIAAEVERIFKETAKGVRVPGFRPGHAPRALVEAQLNLEVVREEALDRLIQEGYLQALAEAGVEPIDRARIEKQETEEDGRLTYQAIVAVMPEVKLGEYRGLKATKFLFAVTDEAVEAELERVRRRHLTYVSDPEHAVEKGDVAIIDYDLEVEGEAQQGEGIKGYPLEVGADTLFPELNEGLLGAKAGEIRRLPVRLSASYPNPALAEKEIVFVVTVAEVKAPSLPELNEEFARRTGDVGTVEELREKVRSLLEKMAAQEAESNLRENLLSQAMESSEVEVPRLLVERYVGTKESEARTELAEQGDSLENYLTRRGRTYEAWKSGMELEARRYLRRHLAWREIAKKEGLTTSEEELEAEIQSLAERDGVNAAAKRRSLEEEDALEDIANRLLRQKVLQLLVDSGEITVEETKDETAVQTESPEHGKE